MLYFITENKNENIHMHNLHVWCWIQKKNPFSIQISSFFIFFHSFWKYSNNKNSIIRMRTMFFSSSSSSVNRIYIAWYYDNKITSIKIVLIVDSQFEWKYLCEKCWKKMAITRNICTYLLYYRMEYAFPTSINAIQP